jgi:hypothetical protein
VPEEPSPGSGLRTDAEQQQPTHQTRRPHAHSASEELHRETAPSHTPERQPEREQPQSLRPASASALRPLVGNDPTEPRPVPSLKVPASAA